MTPEVRAQRKARRYRYIDAGRCPWDGHPATHGQLCARCYATRQAWLARADKRTGRPVGRKRSVHGDAWAAASDACERRGCPERAEESRIAEQAQCLGMLARLGAERRAS